MQLYLDNNFEIILPNNSNYNIFYGPNKIGKTQISHSLKKYYENNDENVLLFDDKIISNMVIQNNDDVNSFEIMPMIQEYTKYSSELKNDKDKLAIKDNLKKICGTNTKKSFSEFSILSQYLNDDVYEYDDKVSSVIYNDEQLKTLFKPKGDIKNFFEIIDDLINLNIKIVPDDIKNMVDYDVYSIQSKIIDNPELYESCPVCYSIITSENISKIEESIKKGSLDDELKKSLLYYLESKDEIIKTTISSLLISDSYSDYKKNFILEMENSIISSLSSLYDKNVIQTYKINKKKVDDILNEIKNFKLEDDEETYNYIIEKFKQHSVYKNQKIDINLKEGKLKITNANVEFNKMSKSEQNYFKFLYFDILVHQKIKRGKLNIIIDDPLDSYDDIYVHDSINIIVNLINKCFSNMTTINIFSHSMYIIYLYDSISKIYNNFNIYWLDQTVGNTINVYGDKYRLLSKIDANPYDYGLIIKISDKLVDKYSLLAFSTLLRNEINMERLLFNDNKNLQYTKKQIENLYQIISNSVNHIKSNINVDDLNKEINELFTFKLDGNYNEDVDLLFSDITKKMDDIDIRAATGSGNIVEVEKNDICYILIYKILLGLKIRRSFEKKVTAIVKDSYVEIGDIVEKTNNTVIINFYNNYKYIINGFNHSSSRLIPPIFVYSFKSLSEIYGELELL